MDHLTEILNIICKRDSGLYQCGNHNVDYDGIMADEIDEVLSTIYKEGKQAGIEQEQEFWLNRE